MMRVKGLTGPHADSVHRIRSLMAPQVAGRRSQVAGRRSQVAGRRSPWTQMPLRGVRFTWTTSPRVTPRLMEKAVARCSWFVARKPPPLDKNGLWLNFTAGCPATAVRFGNRPAPSVGRHLTGQKGLGQPLRTRPLPCVFIISRKRYSIHRLYAIP